MISSTLSVILSSLFSPSFLGALGALAVHFFSVSKDRGEPVPLSFLLKFGVRVERTRDMWDRASRLAWTSLLGVVVALGCSSKPNDRLAANEEGAVREKFAELQSAIKSRDAEKFWALLDAKSQADAERTAKSIQTTYNQARAEEKAKQEGALGLSGTELAGLNGKGFLKTNRFQRKYHELPDSKIDKVIIQGENATIYYLEPDGDKEKAILVRQDGQWKVWLTMPKGSKP